MPRYTGLPEALRQQVLARDAYRCRWCGATNQGADLHHVAYRRGYAYDVIENLITLCRAHHGFVHGTPNGQGQVIPKQVAQLVLRELIERPGTTGSSVWRRIKRQWVLEGRCERHGEHRDACTFCRPSVLPQICAECGNDDVCEGYRFCSECLETADVEH